MIMQTRLTKSLLAAAVLGTGLAATSAHAQLVADGLTYTLTELSSSGSTDSFALGITGINGPSDTEGGRYGVQSFAFTTPSGFTSASAPSGFTYQPGGLNASGCNGSGGFFCFSGPTPSGPALASNSSLVYDFSVTATGLSSWTPDFKVNWVGTKNNYDLVSQTITPQTITPVAAPEIDGASAASGLTLLMGAILVLSGRKRQISAAQEA